MKQQTYTAAQLTQLEEKVFPTPLVLITGTSHEEDVEGRNVEHADKQADHHPCHLDGPQEWKVVIHEAPANPDADGD